jgi:ubiquinone/menaquinone biosynthesis C-methylase UbiE
LPAAHPAHNAAMDHLAVGRYWDDNADVWTRLVREGYDVYRDHLNTPAFLRMLPPVNGLVGLDVGCGEGSNTRQLARLGARMTGIDVAETFIRYAAAEEAREPLGVRYHIASAAALPFADDAFDFATAFMCLMDMPENGSVLAEAWRVVKPGGFFQFSISHPCTDTPHRRNLRDTSGKTYALEIGRYYEQPDGRVETWLFKAAPKALRETLRPFRVPRFHRTLSAWLNAVVERGWSIERVEEPTASDDVVDRCPHLQDTQVAPYFLHVRCRKARAGAG